MALCRTPGIPRQLSPRYVRTYGANSRSLSLEWAPDSSHALHAETVEKSILRNFSAARQHQQVDLAFEVLLCPRLAILEIHFVHGNLKDPDGISCGSQVVTRVTTFYTYQEDINASSTTITNQVAEK